MKLQRSIWLYQEVCDLGYIKTHVRGFLCIKTAYIIQFLSHAKSPDIWSVASITERELSEVVHLFEQLRTLESLCTYLTPFYSCFNSLSGPFRSYACRSCLLKLVLINCILWKSAPCTSEMYYSLFAFFFIFKDCFEIHLPGVPMP